MKPVRVLAAFVAAVSFAMPAASLTITGIDGTWSSASPTAGGVGSSVIRWGRSAGRGQSGYSFAASETPFQAREQSIFVLGTFTHRNFPIYGSALQQADLAVSLTIAGLDRPVLSRFSFLHSETLNFPTTGRCADGLANFSGLNRMGCADHVMAAANPASAEEFTLDGARYTIDILGFYRGGQVLSEIWTKENRANSADLVARYRVVEEAPPTPVPLPAAAWLLLAAVSMLVMQRRRA